MDKINEMDITVHTPVEVFNTIIEAKQTKVDNKNGNKLITNLHFRFHSLREQLFLLGELTFKFFHFIQRHWSFTHLTIDRM